MPLTADADIKALLEETRTIALVGASDRPDRPSYGVMKRLQDHGYRVIPVNPQITGEHIHGEYVFRDLSQIGVPIDMVDIFRRSEAAGEAVDEAIARQAMLETIGDMAEAGIGIFDTLTPDQMGEFFLDFVARSIEGRVMADLGGRGVTLPDSVAAVENAQAQLHDFVTGCTRGQLAGRLDGVERMSDRDIEVVVNQIYEAAFELVAAAGEAAA